MDQQTSALDAGLSARFELAWRQAFDPMQRWVFQAGVFLARWTAKGLYFFLLHPYLLLALAMMSPRVAAVLWTLLGWMFSRWVDTATNAAMSYVNPVFLAPLTAPSPPAPPVELSCPACPACPEIPEWTVPEPIVIVESWYNAPVLLGLIVYALFSTMAILFLILRPGKVVRMCGHGFLVERSVEGSVPFCAKPPDFQGLVYVQLNGKKQRSGVYIRVGDTLYTPKHVIDRAEKVWFVYKDQEAEIPIAAFTEVEEDLYSVPETHISSWQMGSGRFVKYSNETFATVNNGELATFGRLTPSKVVGYVEYGGTTLAGFSGAPYCVGKQILGIHLGADRSNMGYDGAHLHSLRVGVQRREGAVSTPESGSDFTTDPEELFRRACEAGLEYKRMPNDFYQVRVGREYRLYEEDEFERLYDRYERKRRRGETAAAPRVVPETALQVRPEPAVSASFTYQDAENLSRPAATVMEVAGRSSQPDPAVVALQSIQHSLEALSNRLTDLERRSMSGPGSTPAQPSAALPSISPEQREALRLLADTGASIAWVNREMRAIRGRPASPATPASSASV